MAKSLKRSSLPKIPHKNGDKAYIKIYKKRKGVLRNYKLLPIFIRSYYVVNLEDPTKPQLVKTRFIKRIYASKSWEIYLKDYGLPIRPYKILSGEELYKYVESLFDGQIEQVEIYKLPHIRNDIMEKDFPEKNRKHFNRTVEFTKAEREKQYKRRNIKQMAEFGYSELVNLDSFRLSKILKLADKILLEQLMFNYKQREKKLTYQARIDNKFRITVPLFDKPLMSLYLAIDQLHGEDLRFPIHSAHGLFYQVWERYLDSIYLPKNPNQVSKIMKEINKFWDKETIKKELISIGFEEFTVKEDYLRDQLYIVYFSNMRKTDISDIKLVYKQHFGLSESFGKINRPEITLNAYKKDVQCTLKLLNFPQLRIMRINE